MRAIFSIPFVFSILFAGCAYVALDSMATEAGQSIRVAMAGR